VRLISPPFEGRPIFSDYPCVRVRVREQGKKIRAEARETGKDHLPMMALHDAAAALDMPHPRYLTFFVR
jgi:hypothetical protein